MATDRRTLLKAAAAMPVVVIPGLRSAEVAAATTFPPLPPHPWQWWCSNDGATYNEPFETMAEALKFARAEGYRLVAECRQEDYSIGVSGGNVIEMLYGQNEDRVGEGEFLECTKEQCADLGHMVSDAIEQWARKHKIDTTAWQFGEVRHKTEVDHAS